MPLHQESHWSVELPEGWYSRHEDESTLFRREGGVGTLMVTLLCGETDVSQSMLMDLASSTREEGHTHRDIQSGAHCGLYFGYVEEETAWREWYLAAGCCVFFASYDCPQGEESREAAEVDGIVAGLALKR